MKSFLLKTVIASVIFAMSYYTKAGLITTTADLSITGITGDYANVSVGDVFQFSTTYDDSATHMLYNSDTLSLCLSTHIETTGVNCRGNRNSSYAFFSNASSNVNNLFAAGDMIAAGGYVYDRINYNRSTVYTSLTNKTIYNIMTDTIMMIMATSTEYPNTASTVSFYYRDSAGTGQRTFVSYNATNFRPSPIAPPSIPEPSTLAIFALGMIGLASRRFKKQS